MRVSTTLLLMVAACLATMVLVEIPASGHCALGHDAAATQATAVAVQPTPPEMAATASPGHAQAPCAHPVAPTWSPCGSVAGCGACCIATPDPPIVPQPWPIAAAPPGSAATAGLVAADPEPTTPPPRA